MGLLRNFKVTRKELLMSKGVFNGTNVVPTPSGFQKGILHCAKLKPGYLGNSRGDR